MPALQSFSLPRSGPRVTARPCPPVVPWQMPARLRGLVPLGSPSQRRFVSEPHCSMLSWASPLGAPPERDTLRMPDEKAAMRGAKDPCVHGPIRWPSPRPQCHQCPKAGHTVCAGEEGRDGITAAPRHQDQDRLRTIELVSSPVSPFEGRSSSESSPRRPASPSNIRQHDPPEGERTAATSEVSWISLPVARPPR